MGDTLESLRAEIARLLMCIDALSRVKRRQVVSVELMLGHAEGEGIRMVVTFPHGDSERERALCEAIGREFAREVCRRAEIAREALELTPEGGAP